MFTGIVEELGEVVAIVPGEESSRITVRGAVSHEHQFRAGHRPGRDPHIRRQPLSTGRLRSGFPGG